MSETIFDNYYYIFHLRCLNFKYRFCLMALYQLEWRRQHFVTQ